ncbi:helix-turn-helix transcriptional regulator [Pontiellaceae bacterium B12227]|nr:helix-turn-helix transcriptional regulator [Pontiellaceae bacterium B12227]
MSAGEEQKKRTEIAFSAAHFAAVIKLVGDSAILSGLLETKRRQLISGLAELIDADGWLWTVGRVDPKRNAPMQMDMLFGGLTDHQLAALLDSPTDTTSPSPCDEPLAALVAKGKHFVRSRQQLVSDEVWYNNANTQTYFLEHGIDQCMYAITPKAEQGFSGIGFFRRTDRPPFSERERKLVEIITTQVQWLYASEAPALRGADTEKLTPRLRSVLALLLDGYLCNPIAELLHLSPHTVKGYIRDIYRHFEVNSQLALIKHFRKKATPPV